MFVFAILADKKKFNLTQWSSLITRFNLDCVEPNVILFGYLIIFTSFFFFLRSGNRVIKIEKYQPKIGRGTNKKIGKTEFVNRNNFNLDFNSCLWEFENPYGISSFSYSLNKNDEWFDEYIIDNNVILVKYWCKMIQQFLLRVPKSWTTLFPFIKIKSQLSTLALQPTHISYFYSFINKILIFFERIMHQCLNIPEALSL